MEIFLHYFFCVTWVYFLSCLPLCQWREERKGEKIETQQWSDRQSASHSDGLPHPAAWQASPWLLPQMRFCPEANCPLTTESVLSATNTNKHGQPGSRAKLGHRLPKKEQATLQQTDKESGTTCRLDTDRGDRAQPASGPWWRGWAGKGHSVRDLWHRPLWQGRHLLLRDLFRV